MAKALAERIHLLRRRLGMSQTEMSGRLGRANNNAVSRLERGQAGALSLDLLERLIALAQSADLNAEWLCTGHYVWPGTPVDEIRGAMHFAETWRAILTPKGAAPPAPLPAPPGTRSARGPEGRDYEIAALYEPGYREVRPEELPAGEDWPRRFVPVVGAAAAGLGEDTAEADARPPGWADSFVEFPDPPAGAFAIRVTGDSMAPLYSAGDMLVVDPAQAARPGQACVVIFDCPQTHARIARLKQVFRRRGRVVLHSINPDYADVAVDPTAILAAYRVAARLPGVVRREE